jgi:predicted nucleic acid-binding protein
VIVIDASALAKYILHEEGWEEVSRYVRKMKPLYSIDHVLKEVVNAVWKHTMKNIILPEIAIQLYGSLEKLAKSQVIVLEDELTYMRRAVEIALRYGITIYDALYIAQAEKYGELLTSDEKQGSIARELGIRPHML